MKLCDVITRLLGRDNHTNMLEAHSVSFLRSRRVLSLRVATLMSVFEHLQAFNEAVMHMVHSHVGRCFDWDAWHLCLKVIEDGLHAGEEE